MSQDKDGQYLEGKVINVSDQRIVDVKNEIHKLDIVKK